MYFRLKEIVHGSSKVPKIVHGSSKVPKKDRGGVREKFRIRFNILNKLV